MCYRIVLWLAICFSVVGVSAPAIAEEDQVVEEVIVTASSINSPKLLMLSGIGPAQHLKDHGIGVLITDHNVRETLDIVDRAYIIHDGAMLMQGTPNEVVQHSGVRQVYLGERFSI